MFKSRSHAWRVLSAFCATWAATILTCAVLACIDVFWVVSDVELAHHHLTRVTALPIELFTAIFQGGLVAVLAMVFVGIPFYLIAQSLRYTSQRTYVIFGFVVALSLVVIAVQTVTQHGTTLGQILQNYWYQILLLLGAGPLFTSLFWRIARPDSTAAPDT